MAQGEVELRVDFNTNEAEAKQNKLNAQWLKQSVTVQQLRDKISGINAQIKTYENEIALANEQWKSGLLTQEQADQKISEAQMNIYSLTDANEKNNANLKVQEVRLEEIGVKIKANADKYGETKDKIRGSNEELAKSDNALSKFANRVAGLAKRVFIFSVITAALRKLRDVIGNVVKGNKEFETSLEQLKNSLWVAFEPILNFIISALQRLIQWLGQAITMITKFVFTALGKSYEESVKNAAALKKQSKAYEEVGKSAKKASGGLAAFDEVNTLAKEDDSVSLSAEKFTVPEQAIKTPSLIAEATNKAVQSIKDAWSLLQPFLKNLWNNTGVDIVAKAKEWGKEIVSATGDSFSRASEYFTIYKEDFADFLDGLSQIIDMIWANVKPLINSVIEKIRPILNTTIDFIANIVMSLGNFFGFFKNGIHAVVAFFKGNMDEANQYAKKALANFVNIFVGIANAIIAVINNLWTSIFAAFKGTVNSIAGVINKIGSWLGKDWNLEFKAKVPLIPSIPKYTPKLATGAVIPPNREFLAVLGDQKRGTNIEAPLDTIKQALIEALGETRTTDDRPIIIKIGEREIAKATRSGETALGKQTVFGGFANAY